jgi:hypothetical protein
MKRILVVLAILAVAGVGAFAQTDSDAHNVLITVSAIAALDLNNTTDVVFTTTAPALAGDDPGPTSGAPATDVTKRLWYTACNASGFTRRITVGGSVATPAGCTLTVNGNVEAGAGTNSGPITIGVAAQVLVTGIPSVATGRLVGDGAGLTYSFWVSNPALLVVGGPTTILVTYTLTDDIY